MTHQTLAEFYQQHDIKYTHDAVITEDPSCAYCNPIIRQSVEFKQFLDQYRQYQVIKSLSQKTINRVDRFLDRLEQARTNEGNLTDSSKVDLKSMLD